MYTEKKKKPKKVPKLDDCWVVLGFLSLGLILTVSLYVCFKHEWEGWEWEDVNVCWDTSFLSIVAFGSDSSPHFLLHIPKERSECARAD